MFSKEQGAKSREQKQFSWGRFAHSRVFFKKPFSHLAFAFACLVCLRAFAFALPSGSQDQKRHHGPHENQRGEKLRGSHFSPGNEAAIVPSKALHQEAGGAVQNQIPDENLSLELALSVEIDQDQENREPGKGFKYLGRVKRNVEWG